MAPARRTRSVRTSETTPQQRLSFGPNAAANKISKPGSTTASSKSEKKKKTTPVKEIKSTQQEEQSESTEPTITPPSPSSLALRQTTTTTTNKAVPAQTQDPSPSYTTARSLPAQRIKQYWAIKLKSRLAPRVHQSSLSTEEKILREFDLSSQFGPSIGLSREKRWVRAEKLGLKPPVEVLAVLIQDCDEQGKKDSVVERLMEKVV